MAHTSYPPFSIDPIQDLIKGARAGTLRDNLPLVAKCAWEITGMGLGATVGEPADHPHAFGSGEPIESASDTDLAEAKSALESVEGQSFGAAEDAAAIDPATLAMLIQLAVTIITNWLEKRRS